jgi:hypothetical protein
MTDEILGAYLAGEATDAERQQVKDWMAESAENKKLFYEFRLLWNESKEVQPDVSIDVEEAWAKFQKQVEKPNNRPLIVPFYRSTEWLKIAAILILLAGGGLLAYLLAQKNTADITEVVANNEELIKQDHNSVLITDTQARPENDQQQITNKELIKEPVNNLIATNTLVVDKKSKKSVLADDCNTKKFACNSTPCPIEICIIQKGHCNGGKPLPIFNCSIIQPDEAGRLCYGGVDEKFYEDCAIAIQEIRIKRISTGETIVLDQQSSPLTAQEVFSYISGQKKGDIIAGVFQNDCNDEPGQHSLTIENQYGSLLFR